MSLNGHVSAEIHAPREDETILVLVRHGVTSWNVERRFQGQLDVPLSPEGEAQARSVAEWLTHLPLQFTAMYSSDLRRSAATAREIGLRLGIEPVLVLDLRELNAGDWSGLTVAEVEERYPGDLKLWRENIKTFALPGGESIPDVQARMHQFLAKALQQHTGEAIIAVSHGAALSAYLAALHHWDLQETWDSRRARMSNTGVTAVAVPINGRQPVTLFFDSTAHLSNHVPLLSVIDPEPGKRIPDASGELAV